MKIDNNQSHFTQGEIAAAIQIWNRAAISLLDIRHNLITPGEAIRNYRLPAGAFLYTGGGKAEITLNDTAFTVDRFGLFHGGKGTQLSIQPQCDWLEYYMVLYKAGEPPFHRREYTRLIESNNPFRLQYGFPPENPIFIAELLRKMYERWKGPTPLNLFYGKSAFYQLVYAVYEELERGSVCIFEPDSVVMTMRYLDEHYGDEISMQELCGMLGISYSHFYKSFKERNGVSPQEYLIQARLSAAKHWLQDSDMPMRKIAEHCGFTDERSFYRLFAKCFGVSPNTYRKNSPLQGKDITIENEFSFQYNEQSRVSHDELKGKGETFMFKQIRSKAVMAAALSLMLLLSACGTVPENTGKADPTPTSAVTAQVAETEGVQPVENGTRTISTVMGDIEIPANPQRVVVNWYIGEVLATGLNVVGYNCWAQETMPFYDQMIATTKLENWQQEDVMALEPDLIITYSKDDFETFSKIAPVLVIDESVTSPERSRIIGDATGHSETANKNIETFEVKLAAAKEAFQSEAFEGKTFSIMEDWGASGDWSGVAYETGSRGGTLVYKYLGLQYPDKLAQLIESTGEGRNTLSYEVAHEYFGDYILWFRQAGKESEYAKTDIWKSIPAVAEGRVLEIPGEYQGLFYYDDVLSLTAQLDYLVDALNALAD